MKDGLVYMRTTRRTPQRVDVIYRRVDDDFWTRGCSAPGSTLGCNLMDACTPGNVTICNAVGTGG